MKIRIRGNSIRLRLTQSEVAQFGESGMVSEQVIFSPKRPTFNYILLATRETAITATFARYTMTIGIPLAQADEWVAGEEVGMSAILKNGEVDGLRILVEKDFACLTDRDGEDESDNFPNPNTAC